MNLLKKLLWILGASIGVVLAIVTVLVVWAFMLTMIVIHRFSFLLCELGAHRAGCWLRRTVTTPALLELKSLSESVIEQYKKSQKTS
jgi:hypothetical protein